MNREQLISEAYLQEQQRLHAAPRGYGGRGSKWATVVHEIMKEFSCCSMLDYGCGQGTLVQGLQTFDRPERIFREYDPAIAGKEEPPAEPSDLVVCTDVLEHIESEKIHGVLTHVATLTGRVLFVVVSLVPTSKTLSDGRQAHILLRSVEWWKFQLEDHGFLLSRTVKGRDPKKDHKQLAAVFIRCVK